MQLGTHDPSEVPEAIGGYTNGLEVQNASRLLFISGQIPQEASGDLPTTIEGQCRQAWANVLGTLTAAEMAVPNLIKVTTFLGDRSYAAVNREVRREILGEHRPVLTVIVADIFDPNWMLEIEAVAAD
jgi:enamine deaminase RidA (YjgF/YER057c/UK114 family)